MASKHPSPENSPRMLATLLKNLPGMVYCCNNDKNWTMSFVSEGALALTGYSQYEFLENKGFEYADIIVAQDREQVWETVQTALKEHKPFQLSYRIIHKEGAIRWVWEQGQGVYAENGELEALEGVIFDITTQKEETLRREQAEQAQKKSELSLRKIIDLVPCMLFAKDQEGRFLLVNKMLAEAYGLSPQAMIGKLQKDLHPVQPEVTHFLKSDKEVIASGKVKSTPKVSFSDHLGRNRFFKVDKIPFEDPITGKMTVLGVAVDITELCQAEEELKRHQAGLEHQVSQRTKDLESTNAFLRTEIDERRRVEAELRTSKEVATAVIHNIGNVLNSILVSNETMLRTLASSKVFPLTKLKDLLDAQKDNIGDFLTQDPKGQKVIPYLHVAVASLKKENENLQREVALSLDRIQLINAVSQSQQNYARANNPEDWFRLKDLVEDALNIQMGTGIGKTIRVLKDYKVSQKIFNSRSKTMHILLNLVKNAKEAFEHQNEVTERIVQVTLGEKPGFHVCSIKDNGTGIPQENLEKIFTFGFTTKSCGHGFGLAYCAKAAREMGGHLHVESDGPGQGATFHLEIPNLG